jgi:hypothetical protein
MTEIIMNDLAHEPVWVGWREEVRKNAKGEVTKTKVPYNPKTGSKAESNDPTTWATLAAAETWAKKNRGDGVGIELSQLNGAFDCCLCGIDLDTCRDPKTGIFQDWAQEVIERFATYTEVSPSGTGAKLFFTHASADLPEVEKLFDGSRKVFKNGGGEHPPAIEIYPKGRYFTVTTRSIGPTNILRQVPLVDIEWLLTQAGPKFAHKEKQKGEGHESSGNQSGTDQSRSGKAMGEGAALKAAGCSYATMRDALLANSDPEIAEWAKTKGRANGERELHRIYDRAGQKPNGEAKPFPFTAWKDIAFDLEEEWRVERVLPLVGLACLYGGPGSLKTFVLLDLFARMARGGLWGGREVKQCDVIYVAAEGGNGIKKRVAAMKVVAAEKGLPADIPFHLVTVAPNLGTGDGDCRKLIADIEATGVHPGAIAIDTTTQALGGADENGAGMDALVVNATAIANHFQCLVVLVHHTPVGDDDRLRGKTSLLGGLDVSIISKSEKGSLIAVLTIKKMRDEDETQSFTVNLIRVVLGETKNGREVSTLVVATVDPGAKVSASSAKVQLPAGAEKALRALHEILDDAGTVAPLAAHAPGKVVAIEKWKEHAFKRGLCADPDRKLKWITFKRAFERLTVAGKVAVFGDFVWPIV